MLSAQDPNFMEVINDAVAVAAGSKVYLREETYLTLRSTTVSQAASKVRPQSTRAGAYASPRLRRGRIASTYTPPRINEDSTTTRKRQSKISLQNKFN